jgi:hypothetical protein
MQISYSEKKRGSNLSGWARSLIIIIPILLISGLFYWIGAIVSGYDIASYNSQESITEDAVPLLFGMAGVCVTIWIFRRSVDRESFQSMGFFRKGMGRELILGISLGAIMLSLGFVLLLLLGEIKIVSSTLAINEILLLLLLYLAVAVSEEMLFRGYILNNLMKSVPKIFALLIASISFSLMHFANSSYSWLSFLNLILAGLLLGLPYIYTQSLWFPITLHFSWNFFQGAVLGFRVSGNPGHYSIIVQSQDKGNLLNGGDFGFEGSILCVIFQLFVICMFVWHYAKKTCLNINITRCEIN